MANKNIDLESLGNKVRKGVRGLLSTYFLLIIGSILLFLAITALTLFIGYLLVLYVGFNFYMIGLAFLIIGVGASAVGFTLKPLIQMFDNKGTKGEKISRKDYPELFEMIDSIVKEAGCQKPKHVYISDEFNACVFNSSLWGMLFHSRKSLRIGLPLIMTMNKSEFKAILSHEFGHFTQKSVHINNIASISEYLCSSIHRSMEEIERKSNDPEERTLAPFFQKFATKIMTKQYIKLAPLNGILSRSQEFDADKFSYSIAGTEASISALCKNNCFNTVFNDVMSLLSHYVKDEKRQPQDIKSVFDQFLENDKEVFGRLLCPSLHLSVPRTSPKEHVTWVNNESHPTDEERCDAIRELPLVSTTWNDESALSYFSDEFTRKILNSIPFNLKESYFYGVTVFLKKNVSDEEINEAIKQRQHAFLAPFYTDIEFVDHIDFEDAAIHPEFESFPFTEENSFILQSYYLANHEYGILQRIAEENSAERTFFYNDRQYDGTRVPIKEHEAYLQDMKAQMKRIVSHCNYWMIKHTNDNSTLFTVFILLLKSINYQDILSMYEDRINRLYTCIQANYFNDEVKRFCNDLEANLRRSINSAFTLESDGTSYFITVCALLGIGEDEKNALRAFINKPYCSDRTAILYFYKDMRIVVDEALKKLKSIVERDIIVPQIMQMHNN